MNTNSGATYYPGVTGALPYGVGTITVELQTVTGVVIVPASSSDIVESALGSYTAVCIAPVVSSETTFVIVWIDPRNVGAPSDTELLVVAAGVNTLSGAFYVSYDDVRSYLGLDSTQMSDDIVRQPLVRAQRDIDIACGRWVAYADTGLKFASAVAFAYPLSDLEMVMLRDSTCAQVEYRMTVGDDFMIREQYERQGGANPSRGTVSKLCGASYTKLAQGGFLKLHAKVERSRGGLLADQDSISGGFDNLSLNRWVSDVRFGDRPRNVGLIPSV